MNGIFFTSLYFQLICVHKDLVILMEAAYVVSWGLIFSFWSTDKPNQASIYLFILYIFLLLNTVDIHYDISFVITHCMTY